MSDVLRDNGALRREWQGRIEPTCRCFEAACMGRPRIEDFLEGWPEPARSALLRDLVRIEVEHRRRRGERAAVEDYRERFPDLDPLWLAYVLAAAEARPDTPAELRNGVTAAAAAWVGILPPLQDCELLEVLGRGGMGVVYRARQGLLNREVAVKMVRTTAGPREIALFQAEAEAVARLKHPNIVQVHEIGERNGRPCLVLELVEGGSLAQKLAGRPQPGRTAAELVQTLARAMHYAHQLGIVHCDLKPSNILVAADGTLKISDFGVARHLAGVAPTEGAVVGTPSYMAPEQAAGRLDRIGPPTDVYALGAILYELLTGRPPFQEATREETLSRVRTGSPIPPSLFQDRVHPDLETICLKCLHKAPRDRYASAQELAEDLDRYLRGEPIQGRRLNTFERLVRLVERPMHLDEIGRWGRAPLADALAALVGNGGIFALIQANQPVWLLWLWLLGLEAVSLWLFWHLLRRGGGKLTDTERDLRIIWVGYAFGSLALALIYCPPFGATRAADLLHAYPPVAVLIGVILFAEGRMYWGRLYLLGLLYFALAVLLRFALPYAPLLLAGLYAVTILYLGRHGRRAAREAAPRGPSNPS
jgi:serine/threonine-protein kinase